MSKALMSTIQMSSVKKVHSSMLDELSFDARSLTMFARFKTGNVYSYYPVYQDDFDAISQSETPGSVFTTRIRNNDRVKTTKIF